MDQPTDSVFNSSFIFNQVYKWKWILIISLIIAAIASAIFSSPYFITPLYKSSCILYPTVESSVSRTLIADKTASNDLLKIGEEEQTEQMLQFLQSNLIRDRIIEKYNLLDHYDIDKNGEFVNTKLFKTYSSNFKFSRTEFMAVKIVVLDKDPQLAMDMANDIASLIDSIKIDVQKERALKGYKIVEKEYLQLQKEIKHKEDSLTKLRKLGIHDYETQAEMINQQLAIELAKGNSNAVARLESKLSDLAKHASSYVSLRDAIKHDLGQISYLKTKLREAEMDATQSLPQKFVVDKAYKAEKKSYPIRWLIVLLSCSSVSFMVFLMLLFIDKMKSHKLNS